MESAMPQTALSIAREQFNGTVVFSPRGFVDLSTRLKLSTALNEAVTDESGAVVVDLCGVRFLDSAGLGVLMTTLRRLGRQGRDLRIVCPPGNVRRIFELSGLESTFSLHHSRDQVL
jgi:anti-sigma B factor antagonist